MGKIIVLGGNIASGKSTVSGILEKLGAYIIDTDIIARDVVKPYKTGWSGIIRAFGWDYIRPDGQLDRVKMGNLIFADTGARKKLNSVTHPAIRKIVREKISYINVREPDRVIVIVIPLLFESDFPVEYDYSWFVMVDPDTQAARLMARDGIDRDKAVMKIKAQAPQEIKAAKSDKIFYNNTDVKELTLAVTEEYNKINTDIR